MHDIVCTCVCVQVPSDGLMLASIEARIRRLSKLAHSCSRQLSCLQRSLGDVPGITVHNIPPTSPLGSLRGSEQKLPEWRFNKVYMCAAVCIVDDHYPTALVAVLQEGDSIFRGMRTVEKWLKGNNLYPPTPTQLITHSRYIIQTLRQRSNPLR